LRRLNEGRTTFVAVCFEEGVGSDEDMRKCVDDAYGPRPQAMTNWSVVCLVSSVQNTASEEVFAASRGSGKARILLREF
jgi:hypothetical protein